MIKVQSHSHVVDSYPILQLANLSSNTLTGFLNYLI